jgi:hypothetical protein
LCCGSLCTMCTRVGVTLLADGGGPPGVLPVAASRWAVHWADNPDLAVYMVICKFCNGEPAAFGIKVRSSFGRARVWTVQTMHGVDIEAAGEPSDEEVRSRVSYMRVPEFFGDFSVDEGSAQEECGMVVGMKIVSVEYLNPQKLTSSSQCWRRARGNTTQIRTQ